MKELYRPFTMRISHIENNNLIDYFYPSAWNKEKRKRFYFGEKEKIVRFTEKEKACQWLKNFKESIKPRKRTCKKCGKTYPIEFFPKGRRSKFGHRWECQNCTSKIKIKWAKKYKNKVALSLKKYQKENPWVMSYQSAKNRCDPINKLRFKNYAGRGILMLMTKNDFKYLWIRDNAALMKKPTIDRIDPDGNYELINCRFIEHQENCSRGRRWRKDGTLR